jgi:hypothetical protein
MSEYWNRMEKVEMCLDIAKKLKSFENPQGIPVDLFQDHYSFVLKLKNIFKQFIDDTKDYSGTLEFEEIGKQIKYHFPISKKKKATFVIKIK